MDFNLLLVEDDDTLRSMMVSALEMNGFCVKAVASAEEGLKFFLEHPTDYVVTDLKMPGDLDGIDVTRRIKACKPDTKILVCTGHSDQLSRVEYVANKVLIKPFDLEILLGSLSSL